MSFDYEESVGNRERKKLERREKTKEKIIEVREQHKDNLNTVYLALSGINRRLFDLQDLIKQAQYQQHGSITLTLAACGRGCSGCPHPQWYKWVNSARLGRYNPQGGTTKKPKSRNAQFFAVRVDNPKQIIAQSRAVKDHTAALFVAEAVNLLERRSNILNHLKYAISSAKKAMDAL